MSQVSKQIKWPKISFLLSTLNGGDGVRKCLKSIRSQDYPQKLIEIIVVDDVSEDDSAKIAKSFGAKVYTSGKKDAYYSLALSFHKATGEFAYMVEQDIILKGADFIKKMLKPLIENENITASFTREGNPKSDQSWVTRFISYHPAQCDPLYEYITPRVEESFLKKEKGYILCKFVLGKVPPFGRMFFRMKFLRKIDGWQDKRMFDHDLVIKTIKAGYDLFAYVPDAGIYHYHAKDLKQLIDKRVRNLVRHYFPENEKTEYRWLDVNNSYTGLKMAIWVVYANLFFPATLRGFMRFLKYKDWVLLTEPIITITTTDAILWQFMKNNVGRKILINAIKSIFNMRNKKSKGAFGM